jgi:acyl-CoA dehydrogenase
MDFELSEEMRMLSDMSYRFAVNEIGPASEEADKLEKYTPDIRKKASEAGYPRNMAAQGLAFWETPS